MKSHWRVWAEGWPNLIYILISLRGLRENRLKAGKGKKGRPFRVFTIIQVRNDSSSLKAIHEDKASIFLLHIWRQSWQDSLRTTDRSRITPKFCGLCWKGKLTFAKKQDWEQSKLAGERAVSGAQGGHVRSELPIRSHWGRQEDRLQEFGPAGDINLRVNSVSRIFEALRQDEITESLN